MPIIFYARKGSLYQFIISIIIFLCLGLSDLQAQSPVSLRFQLSLEIDPAKTNLDLRQSGDLDLLCDFEGNLFLLSTAQNRIIKFSPEGKLIAAMGGFGFGARQFNRPAALASPDHGLNIFVLDSENRRVVRLNNSLSWIGQIAIPENIGNSRSGQLRGLAVNSLFDFYLSDPDNMRIFRINMDGKYAEEISEANKYYRSGCLCMDDKNNLYALSDNGTSVVIYDDLGNFAATYNLPEGDTACSIKADSKYLYICCNNHISIMLKEREPEELASIILPPDEGGIPGRAMAIAIGSYGRVWVVDVNHNRIYGYDPIGK